jgi:hypothetical protein
VFHMDIVYVVNVSEACCKCLFKMFHLFWTYVAIIFYLNVAHVSHLCCKSIFEKLHLFQSYVGINVFILHFASVLSVGCILCFKQILQLHVPNVLSPSVVYCIQVFYISEVKILGGHGLGGEG